MPRAKVAKLTLYPDVLATVDDVRTELAARAEATAELARELAPVDTGAYRDSITAVAVKPRSNPSTKPNPKRVTGARVIADDRKAVMIENGTEDTPAFAVLRRAAEQTADRFTEHPNDFPEDP